MVKESDNFWATHPTIEGLAKVQLTRGEAIPDGFYELKENEERAIERPLRLPFKLGEVNSPITGIEGRVKIQCVC